MQQQQPSSSEFELMTPAKMARIQSWNRGAQLTASDPHSPQSPSSASTVSRSHSVPPSTSPRLESFDVRMMPAPPVPQVQIHLVEPRPVLHHKHSHAASLHSWASHDIESQVGLRANDRDERSTVESRLTWKERAQRASRALFGQDGSLPAWRALNVEKHPQPTPQPTPQQRDLEVEVNLNVRSESQMGQYKCNCKCNKRNDPKRKRTRMCLCILVVLLILLAVIDIIFLNVRVLNPDFGIIRPTVTPTPTNLSRDGTSTLVPSATATATATISATRSNAENGRPSSTAALASASASATPSVLQNCLTQFQLNAPSAPQSYPCDTCFSALSGAPSNAGAGPATQFCAMKAIFDSAGSSQTANGGALSGVGWMKDAKPCGWSGVSCDNNGNINNIILTFPGVPAVIPAELSSITTLTSLKITGDGNLPAGSLPALSALTNLDLENTGLTSFSNDAFSSTKSLSSLTLVRNSKMGSTLPSSLGSLSLRSLIVNGQALTSSGAVFSSSSLASSLQTLDLSSNSITSALPSDLSGMKALAELNLSGNDVAAPFPTAMPSTLQVLNLEGNSKLSGSLPSSMCSSFTLTQCDLKSTGLGGQGVTCGTCVFA
ncbi:hypothetical protein RSAG8_03818, partial [Rhizoctonia solani AG-8 WAC10335]